MRRLARRGRFDLTDDGLHEDGVAHRPGLAHAHMSSSFERRPAGLDAADRARLERAVALLEKSSYLTMAAEAAGRSVSAVLASLPNVVNKAIQAAARRAILACLQLTLRPGGLYGVLALAGRYPALLSGVAGGAAGFGGLAGMIVEIPVTTTIMFQSIVKIARSEGEDLADPDTGLACLEVFALSADGRAPGASGGGYYAARDALAGSLENASSYVLRRSTMQETAPALVQFAVAVAARYGVMISQEFVITAIPVIGALTGASVNVAIVRHVNNIAHGHFIIRALEKRYGAEEVRTRYEEIRIRAARDLERKKKVRALTSELTRAERQVRRAQRRIPGPKPPASKADRG
jgi:hypothetical protein